MTCYQSNQTPTYLDERQTSDMFPTKMNLSLQFILNKDEMSTESKTDPGTVKSPQDKINSAITKSETIKDTNSYIT